MSYASAGVDIEAGDRAVELMKAAVGRTGRPGCSAASVVSPGCSNWIWPVTRTRCWPPPPTGSGTKLVIAQQLDRHDTIGIDLVAMVIDDLVVVGAEPLFMTDYIAIGKVVPEKVAQIVGGIAAGCVQAGCALVGGETAEHPGVLGADDYDLAGAGTGVVNADQVLGPDRIRDGDVLLAMGSSGVHSNGYSLVRQVLASAGLRLAQAPAELGGRTLGEELLTPTRIYAQDCLRLIAAGGVRAFSHITGGGLAGNLVRVLPAGLDAQVHRSSWTPSADLPAAGPGRRAGPGHLRAGLQPRGGHGGGAGPGGGAGCAGAAGRRGRAVLAAGHDRARAAGRCGCSATTPTAPGNRPTAEPRVGRLRRSARS